MNDLQRFKDALAKDLYGITPEKAHKKGVCVSCGRDVLSRCYSEAGKREYQISGLCEECFDAMFKKG